MTEAPSLLEPIPGLQAMLAAGPQAMLAAEVEVAPAHLLLPGLARTGRPVCSAASPAAAIEPDVATSSSTPGRTPHE